MTKTLIDPISSTEELHVHETQPPQDQDEKSGNLVIIPSKTTLVSSYFNMLLISYSRVFLRAIFQVVGLL